MSIYSRLRIRTRLWLLVLLILAAFGMVITLVGVALFDTQRLASEVATTQINQVVDNADRIKALTAVSSEIELFNYTFHLKRDTLAGDSQRIEAALRKIASNTQNGTVRRALDMLTTHFVRYVESCSVINRTNDEIQVVDDLADNELTALEDLISAWLIEATLAGRDTNYVDQLLSLITGYRESLLLIGKLLAEQEGASLGLGSDARDLTVGNELDALYLRLQTITASSPEVTLHGHQLAEYVDRYRQLVKALQRAWIDKGGHRRVLDASLQRVLAQMARADREAKSRAEEVGDEIEALILQTGLWGIALSLLVVGIMGLTTIFIVRRHIDAPLNKIVTAISSMGQGGLDRPINLNREDEWGLIEEALNHMGRDLAASYSALEESEARYRLLVENQSDMVIKIDTEGRFLFANPAYCETFGKHEEELYLQPLLSMVHEEDQEVVRQALSALYQPPFTTYVEQRSKTGDDWRWLAWSHRAVLDEHGEVISIIGVGHDVTERKQTAERLELAAKVFSHSREGIMITDSNGVIIEVNEAFTRITGYGRDEVMGKDPRILSSGRQAPKFYAEMWSELTEKGYWSGEVWNQRKDGTVYAEMLTITVVHDAYGKSQHYVGLFSDITAQKEHQQQLEYIAHYDALTNLPNRVLLADRLRQAIFQMRRRNKKLAVAYVDLDGFKEINDSHGHDVGDQFLVALAARMKMVMRDGDSIARLGGDEFVAVLIDLNKTKDVVPMLARMQASVAQPVHVRDLVLQASASIGVTFYPQADNIDADQLLRQADQAMYQAKLSGKNRFHIFDAEKDQSARGHHESLEHISHALETGQFVLYYQPKVNMRSGEIIGAEALIRWQHPERGLLPPAEFLSVIEGHKLAIELGEWVIESALTQMELWRSVDLNLSVSVNVDGYQLQQADFVNRLSELLKAHPAIDPGDLELEVLETSALEDIEYVSNLMRSCLDMGVRFALDDFGTGYSSLTYFKRLPADQLKIDQSFVRGMLDDPEDLAILEGVMGLATAFRRQAIAEGVETVQHGEMLLRLGCELGQGYAIARPMPAEDIPDWIGSWRPDPTWADQHPVSHEDLPLLFAHVEHRAWIVAIEAFIKGERAYPPPLDHQQCRFGHWLEGGGQTRYAAQSSFQAIVTLHRQVHLLAADLLELQSQGGDPVPRLEELYQLRDELLKQMQELEQQG